MASLYADKEAGRKAEELLDAIKPYLDVMEAQLLAQFKACPLRDDEGRTLIHVHLKVLEMLKTNINSAITTGTMADMQITEMEN